MMQINWNRFIVNLLLIQLRTATVFGFIKAALAPLVTLYNSLLSYDNIVKYKLAHTSQVWSLQVVLNDAFDIDQRRIRIQDSGGDNVTLLNLDTDQQPLMVDDDGTSYFITHNDSAYFGGDWDFVVIIPYILSSSELYRLKALVNYYKLAGKRYDVIVG